MRLGNANRELASNQYACLNFYLVLLVCKETQFVSLLESICCGPI